MFIARDIQRIIIFLRFATRSFNDNLRSAGHKSANLHLEKMYGDHLQITPPLPHFLSQYLFGKKLILCAPQWNFNTQTFFTNIQYTSLPFHAVM